MSHDVMTENGKLIAEAAGRAGEKAKAETAARREVGRQDIERRHEAERETRAALLRALTRREEA